MRDTHMFELLHRLSETERDVQVKLRGDFSPTPIGPGKLERFNDDLPIFRIVCEAVQHTPSELGPGHIKSTVLLPFLFHPDDVLWVSEPPVPKPENKISISRGS